MQDQLAQAARWALALVLARVALVVQSTSLLEQETPVLVGLFLSRLEQLQPLRVLVVR